MENLYKTATKKLDDNFLIKLLQLYQSSDQYDSIGNNAKRQGLQKYTKEEMKSVLKKEQQLIAYLYNSYIKSLLNLTEEKLQKLPVNNQKIIINDQKIATKLSYPASAANIHSIISNYEFSQLSLPPFYDQEAYFMHIMMGNLQFPYNGQNDVIGRLYLNPQSENIMEIIIAFIRDCISENLTPYLKYSLRNLSNDKIVIYGNAHELKRYINILQGINNKHPQLFENSQNNILWADITDYIGFGAEPKYIYDEYEKKSTPISYTTVRSNMFQEALENLEKKYGRSIKNVPLQQIFITELRKELQKLDIKYDVDLNNLAFNLDKGPLHVKGPNIKLIIGEIETYNDGLTSQVITINSISNGTYNVTITKFDLLKKTKKKYGPVDFPENIIRLMQKRFSDEADYHQSESKRQLKL